LGAIKKGAKKSLVVKSVLKASIRWFGDKKMDLEANAGD